MRSESEDFCLRDEVLAALDRDELVDAAHIGVDVDTRVATLVGTVASVAEKLASQAAAESVDGVRDVLCRIDVKTPTSFQRTDGEIRRVVEQALAWDALTPEQKISVEVTQSWVTLSGDVATSTQLLEAERVVSHLAGVRGVTNHLSARGASVTPETVRNVIADALIRHVQHREQKIDIIVDHASVTLRGVVDSLSQKRAVSQAAAHAHGVEVLHDELRVED